MNPWELWKKGFDAWENATASYLEQVLKSQSLLQPSASLLTAAMKTKAQMDRTAAQFWGAWGLPTKRDQERLLHAVNQLQSKLLDLEERLESKGE
jgi:hypothetical protein